METAEGGASLRKVSNSVFEGISCPGTFLSSLRFLATKGSAASSSPHAMLLQHRVGHDGKASCISYCPTAVIEILEEGVSFAL